MTPWYETAENLRKTQGQFVRCECCQRDLNGRAIRMLELDQRSWTFHDLGGVPENKSQGWFPFGLACAKKLLAKHRAAVNQKAT